MNNSQTLEFERPIFLLEQKIKDLQEEQAIRKIDVSTEVASLNEKMKKLASELYSNLDEWERVQLARHPQRPHCKDIIESVFQDFHELKGDRYFADDAAIMGGIAYFENHPVMVIGIEKGRCTKEKVHHNFGMPRPEGYRKALRLMKMASRFKLPIITLVDTPGAYPGIGAEERGQASAIAENLAEMFDLEVPVISIIIGEGGSGGALGIAVADSVHMMQYSIYSVISPESCASILWSDPSKTQQAARSLRLNPENSLSLKIIDGIIAEPLGGAHRNPPKAIENIKETISNQLKILNKHSTSSLIKRRFNRYRSIGNNTLNLASGDNYKILRSKK